MSKGSPYDFEVVNRVRADAEEELAVAAVMLKGALERLLLILQYSSHQNYTAATDSVDRAIKEYALALLKFRGIMEMQKRE